ncbi:MAG TPA: BON domain-containing protein [Thermoguttaceae bacterium]|nr:BON domain-containing protein [Thermoguttaceae bacterium]
MSLKMDRNCRFPSPDVTTLAQECLERSPYVTVRNVSCECDGGVLFLRGRLPSYYQKQLAQEAVAELEGVTQIVNQTEVIPSFA